MMAAVVLVGLCYFICEIYLDDCIVHGANDKDFLENLEKVFQRFSKHKLFPKPGKCKFGVPKVEFCGRVIAKEGVSMSAKKISQVLNFPLPVYQKQLKSFLGLVGYFRPHLRDLSNVAHPLQQMLVNYSRGTLLTWTQETKEVFSTLMNMVSDCSTMYFVDPDLPLYLHTDASDYGIGGYYSKSLMELRNPLRLLVSHWSTPNCVGLQYGRRPIQFFIVVKNSINFFVTVNSFFGVIMTICALFTTRLIV
jgi:hypothetical protein